MRQGLSTETPGAPPVLSVVTPAYNETANLPVFYERLQNVLDGQGVAWEWIVVDDHSRDATFETVRALAARDPRVRGLRLARNSGAHLAATCGLSAARGDCAAVLAADLQDPPETLLPLLDKWREGAQVVWAVRAGREGEKASRLFFSRLYYWIMREVVQLRDTPPDGADFMLIDRRVMDAFREFRESNLSIQALIMWMGFRQASIDYVKQARLHGSSGWSLGKKIKLVIDSVTSFSYAPIRMMSYGGVAVAVCGFAYALLVVFHALSGKPVTGWSSLMVVVLVLGGFQIVLMGVLGEYLWRTLDETRRRPRFLIEDATAPTASHDAAEGGAVARRI